MNDLTAVKKRPVLSAGKVAMAAWKTGMAFVLCVWAVIGQSGILFSLFLAYSVYLIVSFVRFIKKCGGKSGSRPDTVGQKPQPDFAGTLNSFIGRHIDEILVSMPPPANSVRHPGSEYICYYWTKTSNSFYGGSIPVFGGISMFSASGSSENQTLTLFVDPQTSRVVRWTHTEH
jgi:hypothetical protein